MSGSTRSANATVSDWKASATIRNGILYSPLSSLSLSILRTPEVFMLEFQAMLAINRNSVSILYGSPRQALVMAFCIMPCTDRGCSHEKALSILTGLPSSLTNRSSGSAGNPSGKPSSGVSGCTALGSFGGFAHGGIGLGNGALCLNPPGRSIVPSRLISIDIARTV